MRLYQGDGGSILPVWRWKGSFAASFLLFFLVLFSSSFSSPFFFFFCSVQRLCLMSEFEACWHCEPERSTQVLSGFPQLLLQGVALWGPQWFLTASFFCSVLPSEVLSSSPVSKVCRPLALSNRGMEWGENTLVDFEDTLVDFPIAVALSRRCNADPSDVWPETAVSFLRRKMTVLSLAESHADHRFPARSSKGGRLS